MGKEGIGRSSSSYMDFVLKVHQTMQEEHIMLVYEGEVNQQITKVFSALAEKNMEDSQEDLNIKKKVYHVMVECLQNICKHADDPESGEATYKSGSGIFMVGHDENGYTITSGNAIATEKVADMKSTIDELNGMELDEIKAKYKKQMRDGRLSEKSGAGLGFIDMAKKTGNKIEYHFESLNSRSTFFILKIAVSKKIK